MLETAYRMFSNLHPVEDGLNVIITTGSHGDEIAPLFLGIELVEYFSKNELPEKVNTIAIFNGLNIAGIYENERAVSDIVNNDLNRSFFKSMYIDRDNVVRNLTGYINSFPNPYIIDIHSSPRCASIFLFDYKNEIDGMLCKCIDKGLPYAVRASDTNTLKNYRKGVTYEIPGMGENYNSFIISEYNDILYNIVEYISLLDNHSEILIPFEKTIKHEISPYTGLINWFADVSENDHFGVGVIYAEIIDLKGDTLYTCKSPVNGLLIEITERDFVVAGQTIATFQPNILKEEIEGENDERI